MATDRKYWRQNLTRSLGHIDDILQYIEEVGAAFATQAKEIESQGKDIPQDYTFVIEGLLLAKTGCEGLKELITTIRDSC